MIIIPAIDIFEDKVVRLTKGNFENVTYYKNSPLKQAQFFESLGFKLVHIVDLIGSKSGKFGALEIVREIKKKTSLKVEFGGGIRDVKTMTEALDAGVDYCIIGSLAVKNKKEFELIIDKFSPAKIISAVDVKEEYVQVCGWTEDTSISVFSHIDYCSPLGIERFLCTDVTRDGMLTGLNNELYKKIINKYPSIKLLVSGGVRNKADVEELKTINPFGVIIGKAIYEGKIKLEEMSSFVM